MAHDVHDLIQLYDANIHSQIDDPSNPDLCSCGCPPTGRCVWQQFFDVLVENHEDYGTPYPPDLFTIQGGREHTREESRAL